MTRRILLLVGCALLLGSASAQTVPEIGRVALWNLVYNGIKNIPKADFETMYDYAAAPGVAVSNRAVVIPFTFGGNLYKAEVYGNHAIYGWSYAAAKGFMGDTKFQCYFLAKCGSGATFEELGPSNFRVSMEDAYGSWSGTYVLSEFEHFGKLYYYAQVQSGASGQGRGLSNIFNSPPVQPGCGNSPAGSSPESYETKAEANSAVQSRFLSVSSQWAQAVVGCVPWTDHVKGMGSILSTAWAFAIDEAKKDNSDPLRFFKLEGVTVKDDTVVPPDPNKDTDGDGQPDSTDPYPNDPTNTPPPSSDNPWEVAPGDEETNCSIVNIPCNLRKLFVPQVDWKTEWNQMQQVMSEKMPFSYVTWLGDGSARASAANVGIELCAPIQFDQLSIDWCNSDAVNWWRQYGVKMLFAYAYISYLIAVVNRIRA